MSIRTDSALKHVMGNSVSPSVKWLTAETSPHAWGVDGTLAVAKPCFDLAALVCTYSKDRESHLMPM